MKFSTTLALAVFVGLVATSSAFPAQKRVIYYQRPAQYYAAPQQRMMYVQYMHPSPYARSTQAAEALVAGESVATGTYLEDCDHAEGEISAAGPAVEYGAPATVDLVAERGEDILSEAGVHGAQAEAEAYPAEGESLPSFEVPADVDIVAEENEVPDDDAKVPRDFDFDAADGSGADEAVSTAAEESPEVAAVDVEVAAEEPAAVDPVEAPLDAAVISDLPAPAPIAPTAKPVNRYLPAKKKVYVELDQSVEDTGLVAASEEASEYEEEEEETNVAPVAPVTRRPARRPAAKKPSKAARPSNREPTPLPAGTFFPVNFGGTKGGAIAIANSFSTGEGGSATSHAIAYGSPDAASLRGCVSCKKH